MLINKKTYKAIQKITPTRKKFIDSTVESLKYNVFGDEFESMLNKDHAGSDAFKTQVTYSNFINGQIKLELELGEKDLINNVSKVAHLIYSNKEDKLYTAFMKTLKEK